MIRSIAPADIPLILPLVRQVQALHVADMPARYWPQQDADALTAFYQDRLDHGQTILIDDRDGVAAGFALFLVKTCRKTCSGALKRWGIWIRYALIRPFVVKVSAKH